MTTTSITLTESPRVRTLLALADDALILGHRLSEWTGHAPVLEEELALANIALDLIGQARALYTEAGIECGHSEDQLAYLRDPSQFRNALIMELPNGDFAFSMTRLLLVSVASDLFWRGAVRSPDSALAAIAAKAEKETAYHFRHSAEWLIRLGDGTAESHRRAQAAVDALWPYTGELFDSDTDRQRWCDVVEPILSRATVQRPRDGWMQSGGRYGRHTEHLGHLLAEMQILPQNLSRRHMVNDRVARAREAAARVVDPEIPVLTIEDLGVLRDVRLDGDTVEVTITPTYTGCPAMNLIALEIETALDTAGLGPAHVRLVMSPAWTTDWLSEEGRRKLREYGIAPPPPGSGRRALFGELAVVCPRCGSARTETIAEFGSTACKSLHRCLACHEPFDAFKCH